ncbi:metal-binding protein [[Eubacterium] infirmum]|nr:metal-binding protein [[Eubacterium] infirmum]
MKLKDIFAYLDEVFPIEAAEEWDNSGVQLALSDECNKVMAVIEITESLVDEAIESNVNLIITHHPLFFSNLKSISKDDPMGRIIIKLIQNKISVYSAHTSCDLADGGLNDYFGKIIEAEDVVSIPEINKYCRFGKLAHAMTLSELCEYLAIKLSIPREIVRYTGEEKHLVHKIAWCTGSGVGFVFDAYEADIDAYITGDVKHHSARDAELAGFNLIDVSHYGSEYIFADLVIEKLKDKIEIISSTTCKSPFKVL